MSTAIELENLSKTYQGRQEGIVNAVGNVSLRIEPGELFFLLGPSGCGKTTLLRMIAGFIEPTQGRVLFDHDDVTHLPANQRDTGMVFQSYALWPHLTVAQNVAFGLDVRRVSGSDKSRRVREALEAVQIANLADRKPTQLSGGQQQRVALARALVIRPRVLLLDEPLSNLDAKLRVELRTEIRRVCKSAGMTTVYVTHDQKEALSMADRIAIMREGRVVQLGKPLDLYRRPKTAFVASFLGETNLLEATVREIDGESVVLDAPIGRVAARVQHSEVLNPGDTVTLSVRPEALRFATGNMHNGSGTVRETTYLGDIAHHLVDIAGRLVHVAELNPGQAAEEIEGREVSLAVDPEDVAIVS